MSQTKRVIRVESADIETMESRKAKLIQKLQPKQHTKISDSSIALDINLKKKSNKNG